MKMQKSNSGGKLIVIIAAICIVIYIAALIQSVIRLYLSVEQRKTTAETEFSNIAELASNAGVLGFMDEPFIDTINEALMLSKSIEAIIISGPEGEYAFERQKDRAISWVNNSPRFKNRFDFLGLNLYQPLRINGLRNVNIQAAAGAFDYAAITKILKETLFLILAGFILAFFTLLMQLLLDRSDNAAQTEPVPADDKPTPPMPVVPPPVYNTSAPVFNTPAPAYNTPTPVFETPVPLNDAPAAVKPAPVYNTPSPVYETPAPAKPAAPAKPVYEEPSPVPEREINKPRVSYETKNLDEISEAIAKAEIDDINLDNAQNDNIEIDDIETNDSYNIGGKKNEAIDFDTGSRTVEAKPIDDNDINSPKGLYSQRSNIGWEEYIMDRLGSELHRCASTEKDLTLIVLEFTHGISDSQYASAADEAVNFFTSRDLLFESGKYGITIIYPGIDLETGILKSQAFQRRINEKLKLGNEISIGLSSRAGRLLNAGRILMEAMEALQKAKTDPTSSIIAFKSDPEKYRAFLGKQNS